MLNDISETTDRAGIPDPHLKARYASLNARLFWFLIFAGVFQAIPNLTIAAPVVLHNPVAAVILVPLALLVPSANWLIAGQVALFRGEAYVFATLIGIIDLLDGKTPPAGLLGVTWMAIKLLLAAYIIYAARKIRRRVFLGKTVPGSEGTPRLVQGREGR